MADSLTLLNAAQQSFTNAAPAFNLYQTSGFAATSGTTGLTVTWNASNYDNWSGHSNVTNNTRYTVQVAGLYIVSSLITWPGNATGVRISQLFKNGSMLNGTEVYVGAAGTNQVSVPMPSYPVQCAVGDYLEINGYQNSGSTLTTLTTSCYFTGYYFHS